MKKVIVSTILLLLIISSAFSFMGCVSKEMNVNISKDNIGIDISQDLYGLFIEDISYACDGGLVSNLIANTSFDYKAAPLTNWEFYGLDCSVENVYSMNDNNPCYLKVMVQGSGGLFNKGYVEYYKYLTEKYQKGLSDIPDMGFKKDSEYKFACYMKNIDYNGHATACIEVGSERKQVLLPIPEKGGDWEYVEITLTASATEDGGLGIYLYGGEGTLLFDSFELIPKDSYGYSDSNWKYVSLRSDLYNALKELNPSFIRFPGGCLAEGTSLEELYDWKETIGPLCERKHYSNIWNDDENGLTYDNTNSMGYHEYFQLCEDLGAKALPILNAGTICQFQMYKDGKKYRYWEKQYRQGKISEEEWNAYLDQYALKPGTEEFDAYVQDILDLIEYANGDVSTTWGAKRAENGHSEPFNLQYVGIGNENWGDLYWRNFDAIYNVIKEKHPEIKIISSAGPWFTGSEKDESWNIIDEKYSDTMVDEHYYLENNQMFKNNDYYDNYSRDREVFVGEYATWCQMIGKYITRNNIWAAIEEASYMTGLERNSDVVKMASYAPTFAKINSQTWEVNLIWFDSQNIVLTPNYFNQMLFSNNLGKQVVNTQAYNDGCYSVTTVDQDKQIIYFKIVNTNSDKIKINLDVNGFGNVNVANMQYISNPSKAACNELGSTTVIPYQVDCSVNNNVVSTEVDGYSINIVRVAYGDNDGSNFYSLPELPSNMEQNVTKYTKPYLTQEGFIAICIVGGLFVLGSIACIVIVVLRKKGIIKFSK
ncbi:MAG: hypothetical protein K5923_00270 [Clostridia bacterium]|nr:hypothetical protein [Clostridia bacterium]